MEKHSRNCQYRVIYGAGDPPKTEKEARADSSTTFGGSFRDNWSGTSAPREKNKAAIVKIITAIYLPEYL